MIPGIRAQTVTPQPRIAVVIPCYNTSTACGDVIHAARHAADAVIAVDDGSTDDTFPAILAAGCPHLRFPDNRGKGAALRAGIEEVLKGRAGLLGDDFDYIVTMDGDRQHDPALLPRFVEKARQEPADLVIGVRNLRAMPTRSKTGNYASRLLFLIGTGRYVTDTQSGFRLMSARLAAALLPLVSWKRYETESDVLVRTLALGFHIATVEIPTIYFEGNRRSHFHPIRDSLRVVGVLGRYALVSLGVTALDVTAFALLAAQAPAHLVRANVVARCAAVAIHFVLSRQYAFRVHGRFRYAELLRYLTAIGINLALTTWLLLVLNDGGMPVLIAKITAQLLGFALSFILLDRFVFRRPSPRTATDWDAYYRRPFATARWSRRIMESELVRVFRAFAPIRRPLAVLEIGGANSCFLPRLMQEFTVEPYTLLDNSEEGMRLGRERFTPAYGGRVEYVTSDVFGARLSRQYDVVLSVGLLEHFTGTEIDQLIRLHKRWVREDGLVVITVPTPTAPYRLIRGAAELLGIWRFPDEEPLPRRRLVELIRGRGLVVLSERTLWLQLLTQSVVAARAAAEVPHAVGNPFSSAPR